MVKFKRFAKLGEIADELLGYVVIVARHKGKYIFCQHKERDTWESPGGRREHGETIIESAKRELFEETGATKFTIKPICVFVVEKVYESFGVVFFADVEEIGEMPECEISKIELFDELPTNQTYPDVHPKIFAKVLSELNI
jgi:8-oxo-dGTP diphosphatase